MYSKKICWSHKSMSHKFLKKKKKTQQTLNFQKCKCRCVSKSTLWLLNIFKDIRKCAGRRGENTGNTPWKWMIPLRYTTKATMCKPRNMLLPFNQWRAERLLNAGWFTQQAHTPRWICNTYTIGVTHSMSSWNEFNPHCCYCHICAQSASLKLLCFTANHWHIIKSIPVVSTHSWEAVAQIFAILIVKNNHLPIASSSSGNRCGFYIFLSCSSIKTWVPFPY